MWLQKGYSENGLAYTEDGGATWKHCEGANAAIAVGIGKAKDGADYETIYIWGNAKVDDPIGIYRSTDKCKTFERVNDDMHQFGGPGNGNFVQGDMNNFGVVYMSTVGRGLIIGSPAGLIPTQIKKVGSFKKFGSASLQISGRNLFVNIPSATSGSLHVCDTQGRLMQSASVQGSTTISLNALRSGNYIAKVVDSDGKLLITKRIMLK